MNTRLSNHHTGLFPLLGRMGLVCTVLTGLVGVLQFLRLGPVLTEAGPAIFDLLALLPLSLPSFLPITASVAWFLTLTLALREHTQTGWWLALRLQGESLSQSITPFARSSVCVFCLVSLCALYTGPRALQELSQRMAQVYVFQRLSAQPNHPIALSPTLLLSAENVTPKTLHNIWFAHRHPTFVLTGRARRATLSPTQLSLQEVQLRKVSTQPGEHTEPNLFFRSNRMILSLEGQLKAQSSARWQRYIPRTEREATLSLLYPSPHAQITTHRAHTAFFKRLALCFAPFFFSLYALALSQPTRRGHAYGAPSLWSDATSLVGLGIVVAFYGLLRAGELIAQAGGWAAWVLLLPCISLSLPLAGALHREIRRW